MNAARIRAMTGGHWLVLFGLVALGWAWLYAMSIPAEMRALSQVYGAGFWADLCRITPDAAGWLRLWAMWALMSAAMMLPTALPALAAYDDLPSTRRDFGLLVAGYLAVWIGFSALASGLQLGLFRWGLVDETGLSLSVPLSGGLLILAGAYQFSALKAACMTTCRAPFPFFMAHWQDGPWRMGLRLGAVCIGCCWALMLLAFVGGVMSLTFMGLATALMIFEKLPDLGRPLTRPLGWVLMAAGAWMIVV